MKKPCRKFAPKASSRKAKTNFKLILVNNPKNSHCMQGTVLQIRDVLKENYQIALKKITLFFFPTA